MRETMKNLIKNTITSIGIALTVFCVTGMVFDIAYDGNFSLDNYQFSKMVIGCLIVGLGFGLPTMIYHKDNLPTPFKVIIHMGTGCVIYTIVVRTACLWSDTLQYRTKKRGQIKPIYIEFDLPCKYRLYSISFPLFVCINIWYWFIYFTQYFFHYKEEAGTCEVSPPGLWKNLIWEFFCLIVWMGWIVRRNR